MGVDGSERVGTYHLSRQAQKGINMLIVNYVDMIFLSFTGDMMPNDTETFGHQKKHSELHLTITSFFLENPAFLIALK